MSIEDVIDVETRVTEGVRRDAFERGVELGTKDGKTLGYRHGFSLASELAQYAAFVRVAEHVDELASVSARASDEADELGVAGIETTDRAQPLSLRCRRSVVRLKAALEDAERDPRAAAARIDAVRALYKTAATQAGWHTAHDESSSKLLSF